MFFELLTARGCPSRLERQTSPARGLRRGPGRRGEPTLPGGSEHLRLAPQRLPIAPPQSYAGLLDMKRGYVDRNKTRAKGGGGQ